MCLQTVSLCEVSSHSQTRQSVVIISRTSNESVVYQPVSDLASWASNFDVVCELLHVT